MGSGSVHFFRSISIQYSELNRRKKRQKNVCVNAFRGGTPRKPKDPKKYANIEDLRRELEQQKGQAPFTLTRTINWLSTSVNNGGQSLAFQAYKWVMGMDMQPHQSGKWRRPNDVDAAALIEIESKTNPETLEALQALLLVPRSAAVRIIYRCPSAAELSSFEIMQRIVDLKALFPGSNAARMVELVPTAFLSTSADWRSVTLERIKVANSLLRNGLEGADIDAMVENDATILFEDPESLQTGINRLKDLWKVDSSALQNSDPDELALAVRALSLTGPPTSL